MTDPTLAAKLEDAQRDYQQLYSQYQQELLYVSQWQKRMKTENETLTQQIADIVDNVNALAFHAHMRGASPDTLDALTAAQSAIRDVIKEN